MTRSFLLPLALVGLLCAVAFGKAEVGKPAPSVTTKKVVNGQAIVDNDLRGKVVLLQLIITSSKPCKDQVEHLKKLHEAFAEKGLVIIGLCGESKEAVEAFVKLTKAEHPIVYGVEKDRKTWGLMKGYPTSYLLDVDGNVVWMDNWADKGKEAIEKELARITDRPWLPPKYKELAEKADAGSWKDAGKLLKEALAADDLDPLDKPRLEAMNTFVQKAGWKELEAAKALHEAGKWRDARDAYRKIVREHEGLEPAAEAQKSLDALLADKDIAKEMEAWDFFDEMKAKAAEIELTDKKKAISYLRKVVMKYRKTAAGQQAAYLIELLKD